MFYRIVSFVFVVTCPVSLTAGWLRTYGGDKSDVGSSVEQTSEGGYIVAGTTKSLGDSEGDIWLLKFNEIGDTLWTRVYGDTGADEGYCVRETPDGGYILATSLGLIKTNDKGVVQWTRPYPGKYVDLTSNGGYVAISTSLLVKLNSAGDTLWTHAYAGLLDCVRQTSDGYYILAGHYYESGMENQGYLYDYAWYFKTDTIGNIIWGGSRLGYSGTELYTACETKDSGYVFGGNHNWDDVSGCWLILIKTNPSGEVQWEYTGFDKIEGKQARCVSPTTDGGCVIAGGDWYTIEKYDSQGNSKWERRYFDANSVQQTQNGGFILTGSNDDNLFLLKTEANGDTLGISEQPSLPVPHLELSSPIGSEITLRYSNCAGGFNAQVYDAGGRKVDEIQSPATLGSVVWGVNRNPGVYFIRSVSDSSSITQRVILIK